MQKKSFMKKLRPVTINDAKLLFKWSNDKTVRFYSINQSMITWEEHILWLKKGLKSKLRDHFVLELDEVPIGQIRLEKINKFWEIDYSISSSCRGKGYGSFIINQIINQFPKRNFRAKVKVSNIYSCKVFESLNFEKKIKKEIIKYHRLYRNTCHSVVITSNRKWNKEIFKKLSISHTTYNWFWIDDKDNLKVKFLDKIKPKYIFFPHWSFKIPDEIYSKFQCIVFHMTDLPYGRGGSPLQNLILNKKNKTKISAIKVNKQIDSGPIYLKKELELNGTAKEIFLRAGIVIEKMIKEILALNPKPKNQDGEPYFFKRRKPKQSNIKELDNLEDCYDFIRMLDCDGYPKAFFETNSLRFEFENALFNKKNSKLLANVRIFKK